jgi:hypothetical protein
LQVSESNGRGSAVQADANASLQAEHQNDSFSKKQKPPLPVTIYKTSQLHHKLAAGRIRDSEVLGTVTK